MEICVVCDQRISDSRQVWTLNCEHTTHMSCLKRYIVRQCPTCAEPLSNEDCHKRLFQRLYRRQNFTNNDSGYESN